MAKLKWTAEELVEMYLMRKEGKLLKEIGERFCTSTGSIFVALKGIDRHLAGIVRMLSESNEEYTKAVKMIKSMESNGKPRPVLPTPPSSGEDNLKKLENAFTVFQSDLVAVIEAEASRRADEIVKQKEEEIAKLKDYYEKELQKYQAIIAAAQNSNMVGFLRKKWLGQK